MECLLSPVERHQYRFYIEYRVRVSLPKYHYFDKNVESYLHKKNSIHLCREKNETNSFQCPIVHYRKNNFVHDRIRSHSLRSCHSTLLSNKHEDHLRIHMDKPKQLIKRSSEEYEKKCFLSFTWLRVERF